MLELTLLQKVAIWVLPVLFAITVHEVAHGWVAKHLGDSTADQRGRLTLNPIKHIDPVGTLLVPGLLLVAGGVMFGWAKPVPVEWRNLRWPKRDMAFVAIAGPAANLIMALLWAMMIKLGAATGGALGQQMMFTGAAGILINSSLMVLNMLPLPPLDGSRVLLSVLPVRIAVPVSRIEPYGLIILMVLLLSGVLGRIMLPLVTYAVEGIASLMAIPPSVFYVLIRALL